MRLAGRDELHRWPFTRYYHETNGANSIRRTHQVAIVLDIVNQPVLYLHHAKDVWKPDLLHGKGQDAAMNCVSKTRRSACRGPRILCEVEKIR